MAPVDQTIQQTLPYQKQISCSSRLWVIRILIGCFMVARWEAHIHITRIQSFLMQLELVTLTKFY